MSKMNLNANEFVPSDDSIVMKEIKWFDDLEKEFVKMNAWLFEDEVTLFECPIEDKTLSKYNEHYVSKISNKKERFQPKLKTIYEN